MGEQPRRRWWRYSPRIPLWIRAHIVLARVVGSGEQNGLVYFLLGDRVVKLHAFPNEPTVTESVRQNTTIPIPKVWKVYKARDGNQHVVMKRMPGKPAHLVLKDWTREQVETFGRDLADCIQQLRALKLPASFPPTALIGSA